MGKLPPFSQKASNGHITSFPDVCRSPSGNQPTPIPYPNVEIAAANLDAAAVKIQKHGAATKTSKGSEAGTLKGMVAATNKMAVLFKAHAKTVKVSGRAASKLTDPASMNKAYKQAQKRQTAFESKLLKECDKLLKASKGDKEQEKNAKTLVDMAGKAARGHAL